MSFVIEVRKQDKAERISFAGPGDMRGSGWLMFTMGADQSLRVFNMRGQVNIPKNPDAIIDTPHGIGHVAGYEIKIGPA